MSTDIVHFDWRTRYERQDGGRAQALSGIVQGSKWEKTFTFLLPNGSPRDLTGKGYEFLLRRRYDSKVVLLLAVGSGITNGEIAGTVRAQVTSEQAASININRAAKDAMPLQEDYLYELDEIDGGDRETLVMGRMGVRAGVGLGV